MGWACGSRGIVFRARTRGADESSVDCVYTWRYPGGRAIAEAEPRMRLAFRRKVRAPKSKMVDNVDRPQG